MVSVFNLANRSLLIDSNRRNNNFIQLITDARN